jgi:hypothetical protein
MEGSLGKGIAAEISSDRISPDKVSLGHYIVRTKGIVGTIYCEVKVSQGQFIVGTRCRQDKESRSPPCDYCDGRIFITEPGWAVSS